MGAPLKINEEKKSAMGSFFFQMEDIKKPLRLDKRYRIKLN